MGLSIRHLPIRHKITVAFIGTCLLVLVINAITYIVIGWYTNKERVENELAATSSIFAENLSAALSFNDELAAQLLLGSLKSIPEIKRACVYQLYDPHSAGRANSAAPQLFAEYEALATASGPASQPPFPRCPQYTIPDASEDSRHIQIRKPITLGSDEIGQLVFSRTTRDLWAATETTAATVLFVLLISVLIAYGLTSVFRRLIETPIQDLVQVTHRVSKENDFSIRAEKQANDEIGVLFDSFNDMLSQIQERNQALAEARGELESRVLETESTNQTLNKALQELRTTQEQLVQQEKMASLGGLVAGVAHEINTPIGVGVTAASTLQSATEETAAGYEAGTLTNSGLRKYLSTASQSAVIILKNLNRAAELIHSFKQVAVDQTSSEVRHFDMQEYLDEILLSLRPQLKKTGIRVEVDIVDKIDVYSYPGAISQIITNLVMNSLTHAYPDKLEGQIRISVTHRDQELELTYHDDGVGMDDNKLQRIFDPFFTTRRGSGGSGLGMHIVYNLVTQQLRGKIHVTSEPNKGMTAKVYFPSKLQVEGIS